LRAAGGGNGGGWHARSRRAWEDGLARATAGPGSARRRGRIPTPGRGFAPADGPSRPRAGRGAGRLHGPRPPGARPLPGRRGPHGTRSGGDSPARSRPSGLALMTQCQANLVLWQSREVAAHYAALGWYLPWEEHLFTRYIPRGCRLLDLGVGAGRTTQLLAEKV